MPITTPSQQLKKDSAAHRVLTALRQSGSVSTREAMVDLAVGHPAREICRLRNEYGIKINTVTKHNPLTNQRYARWFLVNEVAA